MYDTLIQFETVDGVRIVKVGNEVDIANAPVFERYLSEAAEESDALVVSLQDCRYIDSSGLRPLVRLAERFGDRFAIVVPVGTQIRRIFELCHLDDAMNVRATLSEALNTVDPNTGVMR